jgi:hypothetical protein
VLRENGTSVGYVGLSGGGATHPKCAVFFFLLRDLLSSSFSSSGSWSAGKFHAAERRIATAESACRISIGNAFERRLESRLKMEISAEQALQSHGLNLSRKLRTRRQNRGKLAGGGGSSVLLVLCFIHGTKRWQVQGQAAWQKPGGCPGLDGHGRLVQGACI